MTSPVDTSVKHFRSDMAGAPVLSGTAGALIALLDACLINGFDSKSATSLVVASGVATLAFSGSHSAVIDSIVLVAGSSITALNGEQKVTALGAGTISFATAASGGTATGAITFKMAPAAYWTKAFSGTNLAAYKSTDPTGTGMYFQIDDTGTSSCRLRGYETMTDVNTGAGLFPLDAQISGGGYINKSAIASTAAVKWKLVADSRGFFLNTVGYSAATPTADSGRTVFIGDFSPTRPSGDPYAFLLGCGSSGGYSDTNGLCDQSASLYHFAPRAYHGLGSSTAHASLAESGNNTTSGLDTFFGPFPSKIDGGMRLSRRFIAEATLSESRGTLPGFFTVPQSGVGNYIVPGSVLPGTGVVAGRKLLAIGCGTSSVAYPSSGLGISFIDITGPWR